MAIYEVDRDNLRRIEATTFAASGLRERADLQRLLAEHIEAVSPGTLIVGEEFGNWEDSRRRIDLLGVDRGGSLVVIELKRTEDGGHMELQALRYAAMVSTLTFDDVVVAYEKLLRARGDSSDARDNLLGFLGWDEPDEDAFARDVRILLVSAEFSREVTTTVLWLNERDLDIRCVRIKPYLDGSRVLIDVRQIIPLPEATDYQVRLKEKARRERSTAETGRDRTRYDVDIDGKRFGNLAKRKAIHLIVKSLIDKGVDPSAICEIVHWRRNRLFVRLDGKVGGSDFVERAVESLEREGRAFDERRYFVADDELIEFGEATFALANQWGERTEEAMTLLIDAYPDKGISFSRTEDDSLS